MKITMDLDNLLTEIADADKQPGAEITPRRDVIRLLAAFGAKAAAASIPMALGALTQTAKAQTASASAISALNVALRLEYLAGAFYRRGLASGTLGIPSSERTQLTTIAANAAGHADYLYLALNISAVAKPADNSYDLTAGGKFGATLTDYNTFLTVAQVMEDFAVRAYKALMPSFSLNQVYLTGAMNIHSVRARHAAAIRYLRSTAHGAANVKPWISGENDTGITAADAFYRRENTTQQVGVNITGSATVAMEAFDEPLSMSEVLAILILFNA